MYSSGELGSVIVALGFVGLICFSIWYVGYREGIESLPATQAECEKSLPRDKHCVQVWKEQRE